MTDQEGTRVTKIERLRIPLRRPGDARELAAVVAFPTRPESCRTTGHSRMGCAPCARSNRAL